LGERETQQPFRDLDIGGGRYEMDLKEKGSWNVVDFRKHSNNPMGFTEIEKLINQKSDCWFLEGYGPWMNLYYWDRYRPPVKRLRSSGLCRCEFEQTNINPSSTLRMEARGSRETLALICKSTYRHIHRCKNFQSEIMLLLLYYYGASIKNRTVRMLIAI
jgi:hypothetical protein